MVTEETPATQENLTAALELAALGWPVFPCIETPGESAKRPYVRNGFHDATTDPEMIKKWWDYRPNALVGVPVPPGCLVIDIDPRSGGSRDALETWTGKLPTTLTTISGRNDGGQHLWFYRPEGDLTGRKLKKMGIDIRDGGRHYVIAPPSLHPDTHQPYRWENWEGPIAWMPWRLHELLKPEASEREPFSPREGDDFSQLLGWVAATEEGGRNEHLFFAACRLAEQNGLDANEDALIGAALSTGLGEQEIRTTITSARRRVGA
jgi:hypothetical protein